MQDKEIKISLCMIVRNEENTIARCLESVKGVPDEIVIVDTGSIDRTKEIVKEYTNSIFDFPWIDDFAAARNFAFSKATKDYILWLDADDVLADVDREKFLKLKSTLDPQIDVVNMPYLLAFDESGAVTFSLRRNRLVKRAKNFQWVGAVHEYLEVSGPILSSDICVTHMGSDSDHSDRNLKIYEKRKARGESFSPRDLFYYGNELCDHGLDKKAIETYKRFLKTKKGWLEDNLSACGRLADCFQSLGDKEKELEYLLKSFEYASPRAEFCCRLGYYFLCAEQYEQGAFWYNLATQLEKPVDCWGPLIESCWTWLPHLQLCVCYDRLGKHELAYKHNELAGNYIPNDPKIIYNRNYLKGVLHLEETEKE